MEQLLPVYELLFPKGVTHYAVGGVFVGLGVAVIYVATGMLPGASTPLESTLSYFSKASRFARYTASRDWRLLFVLGIVAGAAVYAVLYQDTLWVTEVQPWRLVVGGVLVGAGTRLGKGCTSGHGVCGVASLSGTSFVNVFVFLTVAIVVALSVAAMGVTP